MKHDLPLVGRKKYDPLGYCMYCGSTDELSSEHIVPYGLGGNIELPDSSCKECAKITSLVERRVLRGPMRAVRVLLGIQSRNKHKEAPEPTRPTIVSKKPEENSFQTPDKFPILLHFPDFGIPSLLDPLKSQSGISVVGTWTLAFGGDVNWQAKMVNVASVHYPEEAQPWHALARMIAKIGFGMAQAVGLLAEVKSTRPIVGSILGHTDDIGKYVGTLSAPLEPWPGQLHRIAVMKDLEKGLLIADIQLFSENPTPRYGVILGVLK